MIPRIGRSCVTAAASVCVAAASGCSSTSGAGSPPASGSVDSSTRSVPAAVAAVRPCAPATLGIRQGPRLSPATGEHGLIIAVTGLAPRPCTVTGYPAVEFVDAAGHRIRFDYLYSKGQYVTHRRPAPVTVGGGAVAYFLVAKYRCDVHDADAAAGMNLVLPDQGTTYSVPLGWAVGDISFCSGPRSPDPGNSIEISPFEPSPDALAR